MVVHLLQNYVGKKKNFLEKIFVFFTKYKLFAEKNNFIWKKKLYQFFLSLFTEKAFFTENEKNMYLI